MITLLVYLRALTCGFVNFDDTFYVVHNLDIRHLDGSLFSQAFTTPFVELWMPLTWISLAVDYHFWGLNPMGYHLTNILLHAVNTGLVVLIADRFCRERFIGSDDEPASPNYLYPGMLLLAGLLFGIHPLRVESVAWVAERKDVLNGVFSLGAILWYLRYAQLRDMAESRGAAVRSYAFSLVFLLMSLMAKPVSVVIPAMLLVADWYPLGRFRREEIGRVLLEKVPYFTLSVASSVVTIYFAQQINIMVPQSDLSLVQRFMLSGNAVFEYCRMLLYPVGILPLYLIPNPIPVEFAVTAALVAIFTCVCLGFGRKYPCLTATWLCFIIPLLPVLAFFQNGVQAFAARYTYLPSVALSVAMAAMIAGAYRSLTNAGRGYVRFVVAGVMSSILLFYAGMTVHLIGSWKNTETLWTRVITIRPIGRAFYFRAEYYLETGKHQAAADDLLTSIRIAESAGNPEAFNLYALRGDALSRAGRHEESVRDFTAAIERYPEPNYFYHRGVALKAMGKANEAEADFRRAGTATGPIQWVNLQ
nr:tetratricopeptide repeat protein [Geomobilimonas luticola]